MKEVTYKFWNLVVVVKDKEILLINRNKGDFYGLVPPGGKVEFPETFEESAKREVFEETGLILNNLQLEGLSGYINEMKREQFVYVDYYSDDFTGSIKNGDEGECGWYPLSEFENLDIHPDIKTRMRQILENNSYEYQIFWDEHTNSSSRKKLFKNKKMK
ncbi:NUDIX domain-containing protein [Bacillus chungangensis]|uniref:8-oxo-dGTP diphosphatase n=1 Tax=Bacillus chungangensis TaxID=587633 RepID=A0ABT9WXJ7_9BACI|nr:NUDIX domain-containing protein [Bacillus chungangensis]MDQ0178018.1 8-oxo-dGTP diphosphatase [Bacillus chungangensis]